MAQNLVINGETYESVERLAAKNTDGGVVVYTEGGEGGGTDGKNGVTFFPNVDTAGNLSWTNDGGLTNPETVNITGPQGPAGEKGSDGSRGKDGSPGVDGMDGVGISKIEHLGGGSTENVYDENGLLVSRGYSWSEYRITFTNGETFEYQLRNGIDGLDGKNGAPGKTGMSITNIEFWKAEEDGFVYKAFIGDTETFYTFKAPMGPGGPMGNDGIKGEDGIGIERIDFTEASGNYATNRLTIRTTDGKSNTYPIKNGGPGHDGINGRDGMDGKSAYEYAQDGGFTGTEEEFAAKLGGLVTVYSGASPASTLGVDGDLYLVTE